MLPRHKNDVEVGKYEGKNRRERSRSRGVSGDSSATVRSPRRVLNSNEAERGDRAMEPNGHGESEFYNREREQRGRPSVEITIRGSGKVGRREREKIDKQTSKKQAEVAEKRQKGRTNSGTGVGSDTAPKGKLEGSTRSPAVFGPPRETAGEGDARIARERRWRGGTSEIEKQRGSIESRKCTERIAVLTGSKKKEGGEKRKVELGESRELRWKGDSHRLGDKVPRGSTGRGAGQGSPGEKGARPLQTGEQAQAVEGISGAGDITERGQNTSAGEGVEAVGSRPGEGDSGESSSERTDVGRNQQDNQSKIGETSERGDKQDSNSWVDLRKSRSGEGRKAQKAIDAEGQRWRRGRPRQSPGRAVPKRLAETIKALCSFDPQDGRRSESGGETRGFRGTGSDWDTVHVERVQLPEVKRRDSPVQVGDDGVEEAERRQVNEVSREANSTKAVGRGESNSKIKKRGVQRRRMQAVSKEGKEAGRIIGDHYRVRPPPFEGGNFGLKKEPGSRGTEKESGGSVRSDQHQKGGEIAGEVRVWRSGHSKRLRGDLDEDERREVKGGDEEEDGEKVVRQLRRRTRRERSARVRGGRARKKSEGGAAADERRGRAEPEGDVGVGVGTGQAKLLEERRGNEIDAES
ncbi:hypothetical protein Tco_0199515 [Tanacetum coccineum]|uniref:Uncharacterized protein n=1 Tax=Tanacetum coccineum TaxID=301880 RepID=A0ABQ4X394_9ASTR